jgi:predicted AlkP superfamily phosphohydrolase/phosphomutase
MAVLGLDGLSFSLAHNLAASGRFPNLARLIDSGGSNPIRAELPELSPVNWTSFYTASGPEDHGIFGFTRLDPKSYRLSFASSEQVLAPSLFDRLGQRGCVSKVINLPNTYPAKPIKGMLIAGFVAPDLERAVYPRPLLPRLQAEGYQLEADTSRGLSDPEHLLSQLAATLESRRKALDLLWPDLAWDLFVFVLTETDRLGHFLYPALTSESHAWHSACMDLLQIWDRLIGDFLDRFQALPEPKRLLALADHGFTSLDQEVDLNVWLARNNFLILSGRPDNELDVSVMAPESSAFALDPGRIYLHRRSRFARGQLSDDRADELRETIRDGLSELTYEGRPVMQAVHRGEELYPGSEHPDCPDLVCQAAPGFDCKAKFDRSRLFGFYGRTGAHTREDAFFLDSAAEPAETVRQAGATVLEFFQPDKPQIIV